MSILTDAEFKQMRDNDSLRTEANRKILSLESQTQALMAELIVLHGGSHADDKADILAMRDDLITRLKAAVALP